MNWVSVWRWCNTHGDSTMVWGDKNSTTREHAQPQRSKGRFDKGSFALPASILILTQFVHMQSQFSTQFSARINWQLSFAQKDKQLGNQFCGNRHGGRGDVVSVALAYLDCVCKSALNWKELRAVYYCKRNSWQPKSQIQKKSASKLN